MLNTEKLYRINKSNIDLIQILSPEITASNQELFYKKSDNQSIFNKELKNNPGGVFKTLYQNQINNGDVVDETGMAAIFKSTSGFTDKKYYCLHNRAATGSVIKITNPANGKFVYAKVLDLVPDIKQNSGMLIIISNAAAEELGAAENNFTCLLNYSK